MQARAKTLALAVLGILGIYSFGLPVPVAFAVNPPLAGATVLGNGPTYVSATTNLAGSYNINNIYAAGNYNVSARADGFVTSYAPSKATVILGQETTGVNFNLVRSAIITGKVTGPGGIPIAGAIVVLRYNSTGQAVLDAPSDTTDSNGVYAIQTGIAAGKYNLVITPQNILFFGFGCFAFAQICTNTPSYLPGFMTKTVFGINVAAAGSVVTQNVQLSVSAAVFGKVSYNNVGVGNVFLELMHNGHPACNLCFAYTNSSGWYQIANDVVTGAYNVTILTSFLPPSAHVIASGSATVGLVAGGAAQRADFSLAGSATISGYVKDSHNNPVRGAYVEAGNQQFCAGGSCYQECNSGFLPCATNSTDATGHYELDTGLAAGMYNVTASYAKYAGLSALLNVGAGANVVAPTITLAITATGEAHITGTVVDNHGNPVASITVHGEGLTSFTSNYTQTSASGQFDLGLAIKSTESVNISASASGFIGAYHVVPSVSPGSTVNNIDLTLTVIIAGSIEGTVQGQVDTSLIQPQRVQLWHTSTGARLVTVTDSEFYICGGFGFCFMSLVGTTITTYVSGPDGTSGTFKIEIPTSLMTGASWTVTLDGSPITPTSVLPNATYTTITITYSHSSHILTFTANATVPEFPTADLPFVLIAAFVSAVVLTRFRRHPQLPAPAR